MPAGAPETAPHPAVSSEPGPAGLVTVVVPARDEEASIETCLVSILAQDHRELQVVVVDGASTDATRGRVQAVCARDPRVELLTNPSGRIPTSLNLGLSAARGRWLVRVDAHSTIPPTYVRTLVGHLATGRWGGVGARKDADATTRTGRAIAAALGSRAGVGNSAYHYAETPRTTDHVPFGAYPVELLRRLGGWDTSLEANEDYELDYRIRRQGMELLLDPSVRIRWRSKETFGGLFRQYLRYGRGKADVARLHPSSLGLRHLAPPAFVAGCLVWPVVAVAWPIAAVATAGAYLVLVTGAAVTAAARAGELGLAPSVTLALVTMHVSWGLGFWRGLLAGRPRPAPTDDPQHTRTIDQGDRSPA